MSNPADYQQEFKELVYLYHKGTKINFEDLESFSLKQLKSIAESVDLSVINLTFGLSDLRAKQRIIYALRVYIKNNLNPFLEPEGDHVQKKKIKKSAKKTDKPVTLLEFPCQNSGVKNFSMEFEISFTQK